MPNERDQDFCKHCGRFVDSSEYSKGTPSKWVDTGPQVREIPVFRHGSPTACHPTPMGVHREVVQGGYWTTAVPWAQGKSPTDEGCDGCRRAAEETHAASQRLAALQRERGAIDAELGRLRPAEPAGRYAALRTLPSTLTSIALLAFALSIPAGFILSILAWEELLPLGYVQHVHAHIDAADNPCLDNPELPESRCVETPLDAGIAPFVPLLEIWGGVMVLVVVWRLGGWARSQLARERAYRGRLQTYEARRREVAGKREALAREIEAAQRL